LPSDLVRDDVVMVDGTGDVRPGMLLLATPQLLDPNFVDTVVLMLDVDDGGALGVVLNRPSPIPVSDVLETWGEITSEPEVLFRGGPVSTEGALGVALLRDGDDVPVGFREVNGLLGLVDLDTPVELVHGSLAGMRIFAGYAGWGAEQLAAEIDEGSWYVVPGEAPDVFRHDPTELWRDVLRRQPGELAWHSTRPVDPDLN
jgi:putative transcriptional regulator